MVRLAACVAASCAPASQTGTAGAPGCPPISLWKAPLSSSVTMSPSLSTRKTPSLLPSPFLSTPATNSLKRSNRKRWPSQTGSMGEPGTKRGTNAVEPVPTWRVWMAVEEKAVARATTFTTALVTSSCRSCALSARIAEVVLPNLAALSSSGTLRPTPMTKVMTSCVPVSPPVASGLRSVVARKLVTSSSRLALLFPSSTPQGSAPVVCGHWMELLRNLVGRLLSPLGSPSVISTMELTWQEMQSGLLAPVGAVNPGLSQMLLEPAGKAVWESLLSPVKNWPTLKTVSASGVAMGLVRVPKEMPRTAVIRLDCCDWVVVLVQVVTLQSGTMPDETREPPSLRPMKPVLTTGTSLEATLRAS